MRRNTSGMRFSEGHPNELLESRWWWVPVVILVRGIVAESLSFRLPSGESNKVRGNYLKQYITRCQGTRAAGDSAGGLRRAGGLDLRPVRCRDDAHDRATATST